MHRAHRVGPWVPCVLTILFSATASCGGGASCPEAPGSQATKAPQVDEGPRKIPPIEPPQRYEAVVYGTDASGNSTVLELAGARTMVQVDALFVRLGGPGVPPSGGTSPVWLTTEIQEERKVRVGMYEQYAGGMGPRWRAAVWLSSFVAATLLGKDLTDFRFTAEAGGLIDGASAGALMTSAFLASMLGEEVDPQATMTGTVNPDGTIGPVGGIPQKFVAAIERGKTRLGYPVGLRYSTDIETGEKVDLQQLAASHGAEAVELQDVREAYRFMTGDAIPEPAPVDRSDMDLAPRVTEKLEGYYDGWRGHLEEEYARLLELVRSGRLQANGPLFEIARTAEREASEAERLKNQGLTTTAYARIINAWVHAVTVNRTVNVLEEVEAGDLKAAETLLVELAASQATVEQAFREIGSIEPTNMDDHLRMIAAFEMAITGWGFHGFGVEQLRKAGTMVGKLRRYSPEELADAQVAEEVVRNVVPAVIAFARGIAYSRRALETKQLSSESINYMCSLPNARRLAKSFASAAAANLSYFETLVVKQAADDNNIPESVAQTILKRHNSDYLIASKAFAMAEMRVGLPERLREEWGDQSLPWSLGTLAGGILSYFKTSLLVSKEYSLGVETDRYTGRATGVKFEKAFKEMLVGAEVKARRNAHAAEVAAGSIPVEAKLSYQLASMLREGDTDEKLRALEMYWESSMFSQTAVMLARN